MIRSSKIYFPNMDGRMEGEHIRSDGGFLMTLAEKKHLIKDQLRFLQKDSYNQIDIHTSQRHVCRNFTFKHIDKTNLSDCDDIRSIDNKSHISLINYYRINPISTPRILIHLSDRFESNISRCYSPKILFNSKFEFKQLLLLIEDIYLIYLENITFYSSNKKIQSSHSMRIHEELQILIGFDIVDNINILPLKIMCIRKGFSIVQQLLKSLNYINQMYILSLFIENISDYIYIYHMVDKDHFLILDLINIVTHFECEKLCNFAEILMEYIYSFHGNIPYLFIDIPFAILKKIRKILICRPKYSLSQPHFLGLEAILFCQAYCKHLEL